jgi:hypothetical protein
MRETYFHKEFFFNFFAKLEELHITFLISVFMVKNVGKILEISVQIFGDCKEIDLILERSFLVKRVLKIRFRNRKSQRGQKPPVPSA